MASMPDIKRRRQSVTSTRQITKAMQLVAASKLRRAQTAAGGPLEYVAVARDLAQALGQLTEARDHRYYQPRIVNCRLVIVVAGDRGMAGAYNANIMKALEQWLKADADHQHHIISIGRRVSLSASHSHPHEELAAYASDGHDASTAIAVPVAREALDLYDSGKIDSVELLYTRFDSPIRQEVTLEQLLPIPAPVTAGSNAGLTLEPEADTVLTMAARRYMRAAILRAVLDARASEQAARMLAMKTATDNAADLIEDLTLAYNNARQAAITQELAEISAGVEALNG